MAERGLSLEKFAAITPRNSPAANRGATTDAGTSDASIRARSWGSSTTEASRIMTSWPLIMRWISGLSAWTLRASPSAPARGLPTWTWVAEDDVDQCGTMGPRWASGGVMPVV